MLVHKARFLPPKRLAELFPEKDNEEYGYFPKDPTLREFLSSERAGRVLLRLVFGFARERSPEQCVAILDHWVEGGGDGGVTYRVMRRACNLPMEQDDVAVSYATMRVAAGTGEAAVVAAPATGVRGDAKGPPLAIESIESRSVPGFLQTHSETLMRLHIPLVMYCLEHRKDILTPAQVFCQPTAKRGILSDFVFLC